jgi:hypothetical protein
MLSMLVPALWRLQPGGGRSRDSWCVLPGLLPHDPIHRGASHRQRLRVHPCHTMLRHYSQVILTVSFSVWLLVNTDTCSQIAA